MHSQGFIFTQLALIAFSHTSYFSQHFILIVRYFVASVFSLIYFPKFSIIIYKT